MDPSERIMELEVKVAELEAELSMYRRVSQPYDDGQTGQTANIERVEEKIGRFVIRFCRVRMQIQQPQFFAEELREYVIRELEPWETIAPASPDRILRSLRQQHKLDYMVISRSESLYEVLYVAKELKK